MHAYVLANIVDQTSWLWVGEGGLAAQLANDRGGAYLG
jgi:hypothetical protein